ncbi:MAG: (d)CMP kinase [Myxococcota bacterium]
MTRSRPVIALDGPAGAGKSSVAKAVADALGFVLVDTGALYRGIALAAQEAGVPWEDGPALGALAEKAQLGFAPGPRLLLNGADREDEIRSPAMGQGASKVSAHPEVRAALLGIQRRLGADGGVVLEGRDIGTVVFPDAEVKVFLTATAEERAHRRHGDLQKRGVESDYSELLASIKERDERDSTRAVAPLRPAEDAVLLDSTDLGFDEVVARVVALVRGDG